MVLKKVYMMMNNLNIQLNAGNLKKVLMVNYSF